MATKTGKPMGRPKGYSPGLRRVITHKVGAWTWNTNNLHRRIVKTTPDACWAWTGSKNDYGNIFGAYKNDHKQMTQANRLLYMEVHDLPIDNLSIKMTCKNRHCANWNHFYTDKNNRYKP
jgi:hypothetical protein